MNDIKYLEPTIANIASLDNLYMAWNRLKHSITYADVWYDEYEFHRFEFLLDKNIREIRKSLIDGTYTLDKIRPIPFPKGGKDEEGNLKVRQAFWISMKDQLVWVAVCNVLGPHIETMMPGWSTGNRLYVPMWKDQGDGTNKWIFGSFLNSYPYIYRKWTQGWPRYRKVLTASIKRMAIGKSKDTDDPDIIDETDETEISANEQMPAWLGIRYLKDNYFKRKEFKKELFWGGIDIKTFYPSIIIQQLSEDLIKFARVTEEETKSLIQILFNFKVDFSGFSEDDLKSMGFEKGKDIGLPTGLIVGGWLANVYLLEIDLEIEKKINNNHKIIHFRYVDDHTFIAESFKDLVDWINGYLPLLEKRGLKINAEKIQPTLPEPYLKILYNIFKEGYDYLKSHDLQKKIEKEKLFDNKEPLSVITEMSSLNPINPTPLMTLTLQKVSQISHLSLNLLSKNENNLIFNDLRSLITIDIPETEIKKETRISFASTMLSRMLLSNSLDLEEAKRLREDFISSCNRNREYLLQKNKLYTDESLNLPEEIRNSFLNDIAAQIIDIDECVAYAFEKSEEIPDKTTVENIPNIDWKSAADLRTLYLNARKENKKNANKIYYLLMIALDEAPDKVNIWIRTMEFCIKHAPHHIKDIFEHLKKISGKTLHRLGVIFICRQLISLLTSRYLIAIWRKFTNYHQSRTESQLEENFISAVDDILIDSLNEDYYFTMRTSELFLVAREFKTMVLTGDSNKLHEYLNLQYEDDSSFLQLYLINSASKKYQINFIFKAAIALLSLNKPHGEFEEPLLLTLIDILSHTNEQENVYLKIAIDESISTTAKKAYEILVSDRLLKSETQLGNASLREWMLSDMYLSSKFKNSEYFATKLYHEIILKARDIIFDYTKKGNSANLYFDISNIYVNTSEINNLDWDEVIRDTVKINIEYDQKDNNFLSSLYKAPEIDDHYFESKIIFGLGVIYFHLLSGNLEDDWIKLYHETGYSWKSKINKLSDSGKISTTTKKILMGCLLPYVWEYKRINGSISARNQAMAINNINILEEKIKKLKENLRNHIILKSTESTITNDKKNEERESRFNVVEFKIIEV